MMMLPPKPGVCQKCAIDHQEHAPHDQESVYWQYWFYSQNGRWPTWWDAICHCPPEVREKWIIELAKHGVKVEPPKEIKQAGI